MKYLNKKILLCVSLAFVPSSSFCMNPDVFARQQREIEEARVNRSLYKAHCALQAMAALNGNPAATHEYLPYQIENNKLSEDFARIALGELKGASSHPDAQLAAGFLREPRNLLGLQNQKFVCDLDSHYVQEPDLYIRPEDFNVVERYHSMISKDSTEIPGGQEDLVALAQRAIVNPYQVRDKKFALRSAGFAAGVFGGLAFVASWWKK